MTLIFSRALVPLCIVANVLTACGGAATTNATAAMTETAATTTPVLPLASKSTYVTLTDQTSTAISNLAGATLTSNTTTGEFFVAQTSGSLVRSTDTVTLRDGQFVFVSSGEPAPNGTFNDAQGSTLLVNNGLGDGYDFAAVYEGTYTLAGVNYNAVGVVGIPTDMVDLPATGALDYTGTANLSVVTENGLNHVFTDGTATIMVDFATDQATVTLGDFTVNNPIGIVANGPFDEMTITDMSIDGTAFSGGTVAFESDGQQVDIVGNNAINDSQGTLFGYDPAIGGPDEVGGAVLVTGDTGEVTGLFIAD